MVQEDAQPQAPETKSPEPPVAQKAAKRHCPISLILAMTALLLILGTLFYLHQHNPLTTLANIQQEQKKLQTLLATRDKALEALSQRFDAQKTAVQQTLHTLKEQMHFDNNDWLLIQAQHYVSLAQMHAHWGDNPATTIALLQQADALFQSTNNPNLLKIRQITANILTQLQALPPPDLAGLLSQLDAMQNQVNALPLPLKTQTALEETADATPEKPRDWRGRLKDSWQYLNKLVVIQHHDAELKPLMSALELTLLKEGIRLDLQKAQLALLKQDENLFTMTLQQARQHIIATFDTKAAPTAALLQQLDTLEKTPITQKQPPLDALITALQALIKQPEESANEKTL